MASNQKREPVCSDCGKPLTEQVIVISATELLCPDCWPFFLKPLGEHESGRPERPRQEPSPAA